MSPAPKFDDLVPATISGSGMGRSVRRTSGKQRGVDVVFQRGELGKRGLGV